MRVVVVGGYAPSLVLFRAPLLRALVERGHEVVAMAADGTDAIARQLDDLGVRFEPLAIQRAGLDPRADIRTLATLARRLRGAGAVMSYTIKPVIYGSLAARLAGVPRRFAMITGLGYALVEPTSTKRRAVAAIARGLLRVALGTVDTLFVQNPDDKADLAPVTPRGLRVEIVRGSGVDLAHYDATPLPAGPPKFVYLGRMLGDKGIHEFVAGARSVRAKRRDVSFAIAGWVDPNPDSVTRADVDGWVRDGILDFVGDVEDVRPLLRDAHGLILPSHREGTPRSVLEAMSMNRVVITTDAPGCRETIVDGESGLMVPVRDGEAVARAVIRLADSRALMERLAAGGRARVEALYDARKVAAQMVEIMGL